jgi:tight adherence protein B
MIAALDPTLLSLIIGVMSGLSLLLIATAFVPNNSRRFTRRLERVTTRKAEVRGGTDEMRSLSRRESTTPGIDRIFAGLVPRRQALVERLGKTGLSISVGQFMLATIGAIVVMTLVAFIIGNWIGRLSLLLSSVFGLGLGILIPFYLAGRTGRRRVSRFIGLFPEAIDLMVRALRAGLPISEAIVNAGQEIGDPVGAEFRTIESGLRMGRDLDSLLWDIAKRIDIPEFRFFIIALNVQRETGGNLAETLNNLSEVLRRRRAMRAKARAMASEARASTMILGSLPIIVTGILFVTSPTYISPMFTDVRGLVMVGIALGMLALGVVIMVKMAQFEI